MIIMQSSTVIRNEYYDKFISLVNHYGRVCKKYPLMECGTQEAFDMLDEWFIAFVHELGFKFSSEVNYNEE